MSHKDEGTRGRGQPADAGQFASRRSAPPASALRPQERSSHRLDRGALLDGLSTVIERLHLQGTPASIQLIGGGAIALRYWPDRSSTQDLDAILGPRDVIATVAEDVGRAKGWPSTWMNGDAEGYLPPGYCRRSAEWETVHDQDGLIVQIATADTLLAMKLHAANRRTRRELTDLAVLLKVCGLSSVESAEDHYSDFYGEDLTAAAIRVVALALTTPINGIRDDMITL